MTVEGLSPAQQRLLEALTKDSADLFADGRDVPIKSLYHAARGMQNPARTRAMQQYLGPFIMRLNEKLVYQGKVVKPGEARGTYRLYALSA